MSAQHTPGPLLAIERWNCGTMRRYHFDKAVLIIARGLDNRRRVRVVPKCMIGVSVPIEPVTALEQLRAARAIAKATGAA